MPTTDAVADIDTLRSIPEEILTEHGLLGRTYLAQQNYERACDRYDDISWAIDRDPEVREAMQNPPLGMSSLDVLLNHPAVKEAAAHREAMKQQMQALQAEVGGIVFLPAVENLDKIEKKLAALNKKAASIGADPIALKVTNESLVLHYAYEANYDGPSAHADFEHTFAILNGTTPQIPGFEFIATITHTDEGNLVKRIPAIAYGVRHGLAFGNEDREDSAAKQALDAIDLTRFRHTGRICEHCDTNRKRLDSFVVYNESTDEIKQVGRSCLRLYTGADNPEKIVKFLEQYFEFLRFARIRGEAPAFTTDKFLAHCAALVRMEGGYIRGLGYDAEQNWIAQMKKVTNRDGSEAWVEPQPVDIDVAKHVRNWARNEWSEDNDFAHNVKVAMANEVQTRKSYGIAGAVFAAYNKAQSIQREREAQAEKSFIGTMGQRDTFTLTLNDVKWIKDSYSYDGSKPLLIMSDAQGNNVKWFASTMPRVADKDYPDEAVIGGTYEVTATVKPDGKYPGHEDHPQYGKSTIITRAKFGKTISEPQEDNDDE